MHGMKIVDYKEVQPPTRITTCSYIPLHNEELWDFPTWDVKPESP